MEITPIIKIGAPLLKQKAQLVKPNEFNSPELNTLIQKLLVHMKHYKGVGICAPQIGVSKNVLVYGFEHNERYPDQKPVPETVLINTEITYYSPDKSEIFEGCLSIPRIRGLVPRSNIIKIRAFSPEGKIIEKEVSGFEARIIQHEVDHINGTVFPMRIKDISTLLYSEN